MDAGSSGKVKIAYLLTTETEDSSEEPDQLQYAVLNENHLNDEGSQKTDHQNEINSQDVEELTLPDIGKLILRKRFKFNERLDIVLLNSIQLYNAHICRHEETQKRFGHVLDTFLQNALKQKLKKDPLPSSKSHHERFKTCCRQESNESKKSGEVRNIRRTNRIRNTT